MGAALARSGLGRRTALGTATLLIGVNLPDVDVLAYLDGPGADLACRRGWTHGVLALIVLPFLLTGAMLLLDRGVRRVGRSTLPSGVVPSQVLRLAVLAILTHPILDTLNVYGVRWLMPFRDDWFYGDTLFIVDPWLWAILGAGVVLSLPRRRARGYREDRARAARTALVIASVYIVGMLVLGLAARGIARRELEQDGVTVDRLMVAPEPITPFARRVVAAQGNTYHVATFRWLARPHLDPATRRIVPRPRPDDATLAAARATSLGKRFLLWARFPSVQVEATPEGERGGDDGGSSADAGGGGGSLIHLIDLRYADRPGAGFGSVTIRVAPPPAALLSGRDSPSAAPTRGAAPADR